MSDVPHQVAGPGTPSASSESGSDPMRWWATALDGAPDALNLPLDRPRPAVQSSRFETVCVPTVGGLGVSDPDAVGGDASSVDVAALALVLHRISAQDDVVIGVDHAGTRIPVRVSLAEIPTAGALIHAVHEFRTQAASQGTVAATELVVATRRSLDPSLHPLFQVAYGSAPDASPDDLPDPDVVLEVGADGAVTWHYDAGLFERDTIERMAGHWQKARTELVARPDRRVSNFSILTAEESRTVLHEWNDTAVPFPADRCLHQLFEDRLAANDSATAVITPGGTVTYAELEARANRLAHQLREVAVGPEVRVGLCVERSLHMVTGILAILKAGGAYVPLDPQYPEERIHFMLTDSRVSVLLTQEHLLEGLAVGDAKVVCVDRDRAAIDSRDATRVDVDVTPAHLAYVIYTSGSTGKPKGIALRHQGVVNNLYDLNDSFGVGAGDRVLAISAMSFDMCVYEVLGSLAAGATIVVPDKDSMKDPAYLAALVHEHQVTVWNSAPSFLELYTDHVEGRPELAPKQLKVVILGGDWCPLSLPDRVKAMAPKVQFIVLGGATEASIHSIVFPVPASDPDWRSIPYGKPMRNQRAYILDRDLQPVPIGVPGELYLGGIGLARGYFERPELSAEKFLPDPFQGEPGARMYRTGDLARWGRDGVIELLGRMDHQVKIRGHRIELGEINAALREHPAVQDVVVTAAGETTAAKQLVAYVVPATESEDEGEAAGAGDQQVSQWQKIYDDTYAQTGEYDPRQNFIGWISSYTGQPFSEPELHELQDRTIERIRALEPREALEIGCGSGLILFPTAPGCERYHGLDVSPVVIENLQRLVTEPGHEMPHVTLEARTAEQLDDLPAASWDTVILNSVAQHFPAIEYFVRVMEGAMRRLKPGGRMFIGDVRALHLLEAFCVSLERFKSPSDLSVPELARRVQRRLQQEKELFVHPEFFVAIGHAVPAVSRVEVRVRRGRHHNEMTCFHYDVVMHTGDRGGDASLTWSAWNDGDDVDSLRTRLQSESPEVLGLTGIPNVRVGREMVWLEALAGNDAGATVADLDVPAPAQCVDPEDLFALGEELSYQVDVCWSVDRPGAVDVLFRRPGTHPNVRFPLEQQAPKPWPNYGNNPLQAGVAGRLAPELRQHLQGRLPEFMVPSVFQFLDRLPLSPNGKVDRKALPAPDLSRPSVDGDFTAATNPVEEVLAGIWSEVLGVPQVGIHDNFFELGGHSLTAAQVVSRARDSLQIELPLRLLFESPTVAGWSANVQEEGRQLGVDVVEIAETVLQLEQLTEEELQALLEPDVES